MRAIVVELACLACIIHAQTAPPLRKGPGALGKFLLAFNPVASPRTLLSHRNSQISSMSWPDSTGLNPFATTRASPSAHNSQPAPRFDATSSSQGASARFQSYNDEMLKTIEDLRLKRQALDRDILVEEEEAAQTQQEFTRLAERLKELHESRAKKSWQRNEYDKIIKETEAAYMKIVKSSQDLVHALRRERVSLSSKRDDHKSDVIAKGTQSSVQALHAMVAKSLAVEKEMIKC